METRQYTVYKFSELNEAAQDKAVDRYCDINVDHKWWDFTFEDAASVGLKITEFDIDRASYVKGEFTQDETQVAANIIANHGEACETYKTAKQFQDEYAKLGEDGDEAREDLQAEFLNSLCEDYRIILSKEFYYLISREAIVETFEANDYDFTDDGKID